MKPDEGVWYSVGGLFKGPIRMLDNEIFKILQRFTLCSLVAARLYMSLLQLLAVFL